MTHHNTNIAPRILALLAIRRGGSTREELGGILDLTRKQTRASLHLLVRTGRVTRHDDKRRKQPQYTLPGDPLTRPLAPLRPPSSRLREHIRRATIILTALGDGSAIGKGALAKRCKVEPADRLEGDLRRLRSAGKVEMVGAGVATRYRLPRVVRVQAVPGMMAG